MEDVATTVTSRAIRLRDGVLGLLQGSSTAKADPDASLKERIAQLESELKDSDDKLEEMAKSRNEAVASERRVRRGLYRLASNRMSLEDVLKVCLLFK